MDGKIITVPANAPDAIASVVVAQIKGVPDVQPVPILPESDGSVKFDASDATLHGKPIQYAHVE